MDPDEAFSVYNNKLKLITTLLCSPFESSREIFFFIRTVAFVMRLMFELFIGFIWLLRHIFIDWTQSDFIFFKILPKHPLICSVVFGFHFNVDL